MLPQSTIFITVLVSIYAYYFYFRDIFLGKTKPNLVSWFIWMLATFIGTFFALKAGAGLSALPTFFAGFGPFLVIMFSLWRGNAYWKISSLDIICGVLALSSLTLFILTHSLSMSILFAILSDGLAFIPTFIKSWKAPETETSSTYWASIFNNIIALFIVKSWVFAIYSFPIYFIIFNIAEIVILYRNKILRMF